MQLNQLNLKTMLTGEPNRLRHIVRFGNCHKIHKESVAEHSYFTVFYSLMIGAWLQGQVRENPEGITNQYVLNMGKLLARATLHDLEEARSGDFPRPFKYSSPEIKSALDKASVFAFRQCVAGLSFWTPDLAILETLWSSAKDETIEGRIVRFADYLSVVAYLWLEIQGSNLTMRQHVSDMAKYAEEFDGPEYDCMRPLVSEAKELVKEFLGRAAQ